MFPNVSKKKYKKLDRGVGAVWPIFFVGFLDFFNLTKPLSWRQLSIRIQRQNAVPGVNVPPPTSFPVLSGKSKLTGSNPTMVFKFQRNKMILPRPLVMI